MFVILPIACYGYILIAGSTDLSQMLIGKKLTYLGGIFGSTFFVFSILTLHRFNLSKVAHVLSFSFVFFFLGRMITRSIELVPITYLIAQFVLIFMPERIVLYDIDDTLVDVSLQWGDIAIISLDKKRSFLGATTLPSSFFPC